MSSDNASSTDRPRRIAIIGGGISGLAAAYRVTEIDPDCQLTLFESKPHVGGALQTAHEDDLQIEHGVDNFITTLPWGLSLCKRLGLSDQLVQTNPDFRRTFVVHRGRTVKMPDGFLMMAPTRMMPLALTPLLSIRGKIRCAMEFFLPRRREETDESIGAFARRRLGNEAFANLIEPLCGAVYAGDVDKISIDATLSRFRDMERKYGSVIRAMLSQIRARKKSAKTKQAVESGPRFSMFVTLRDGMQLMVDRIAERLPEGSVRENTSVDTIVKNDDSTWNVTTGEGTTETYDAVVLATPSYESGRLLEPIDAETAGMLSSIEHSSTAVLTVCYDREQVGHKLDGLGIVVPAVADSPILAISLSSRKYPHRAPEGKVLLRVFVGGVRYPELVDMEEEPLQEFVLKDLAKLLKVEGDPLLVRSARWRRNMPQYFVGHLDLVDRIEQGVSEIENLEVIGNALHGVGIPDCIHTAELAVNRLFGIEETDTTKHEK